MLQVELASNHNGKALYTFVGNDNIPALVVTTIEESYGHFKAATRTGAGTSVIATPNGNDAIALTDMIITSDKVNLATLTVQFTDGVNTVVLAAANVTDAPCNIALSFKGNWTGWQSAHVDLVTTGNVSATVSLGYYKVKSDKALPFAAWDALR